MSCLPLKNDFTSGEVAPFSPSSGRRAGDEGLNRLETQPPHPNPLPRKAGGEGGDFHITSYLTEIPTLASFQPSHRATLLPHPEDGASVGKRAI